MNGNDSPSTETVTGRIEERGGGCGSVITELHGVSERVNICSAPKITWVPEYLFSLRKKGTPLP